jgi:molybdopterin-synthase adenylyltransferase
MHNIAVDSVASSDLCDEDRLRYSRHLLLNEWSEAHQQILAASRVLVLGLGGLGSAVAPYLASSGFGTLVLADFDRVSLDNLQRQVLYRVSDIGHFKSEAAAATLRSLNPHVQFEVCTDRWSESECATVIQKVDIVVDCTDNFEARYAVNRACHAANVPLVSGAAVEWEGRLACFDFRLPESPCYHCIFPEGEDVVERRCATTGIFAPLVGMVGALQAAETLKLVLQLGQSLTQRLLSINAYADEWRISRFSIDPRCKVCGLSI